MISTSLATLPMHASFISSIIFYDLAYTTPTWIYNLKLVPCKQTCVMHIQVYELAPPTCVLQILIDPLTISFHLFAPPYLILSL